MSSPPPRRPEQVPPSPLFPRPRSKGLIILTALMVAVGVAEASDPTCDKIRAVSVTIHSAAGQHYGSGTLFTKGGETFVLTAHHVVKGDRIEGDRFKVTQFRSTADGIETMVTYRGQAVAFLPAEDAAILKLGELDGVTGCRFASVAPEPDDPLIHCGSYGVPDSTVAFHSITKGSVVALGRYFGDQLFDTGDFTMFPGSSGGGVFNATGELIGFVSRGMGDRSCLFVPVRRLTAFLEMGVKPIKP